MGSPGAGPLLVDAAHQAPAPGHVPGLAGGTVIAGEVDDALRPLLPPAPQQGQAELPAHEPTDPQRDFGSADPRPLLKNRYRRFSLFGFASRRPPEIAQGQAFGRRPALAETLGPPRQDLQVPDLRHERDLPAVVTQAQPLRAKPASKWAAVVWTIWASPTSGPTTRSSRWPRRPCGCAGRRPILALAPGGQEIAGPAVQVDAVDEVLRALGRLAEVLGRRIVGIADRALAVLVVDGELAPDVPLTNADPLLLGQIFWLAAARKPAITLWAGTRRPRSPRRGQALVEVPVDLVPGVVGVGGNRPRG